MVTFSISNETDLKNEVVFCGFLFLLCFFFFPLRKSTGETLALVQE